MHFYVDVIVCAHYLLFMSKNWPEASVGNAFFGGIQRDMEHWGWQVGERTGEWVSRRVGELWQAQKVHSRAIGRTTDSGGGDGGGAIDGLARRE